LWEGEVEFYPVDDDGNRIYIDSTVNYLPKDTTQKWDPVIYELDENGNVIDTIKLKINVKKQDELF